MRFQFILGHSLQLILWGSIVPLLVLLLAKVDEKTDELAEEHIRTLEIGMQEVLRVAIFIFADLELLGPVHYVEHDDAKGD